MNNQTNDTSSIVDYSYDTAKSRHIITMSLLIVCAIPSLLCFLVIFYYFIRLRKRLLFDRINHHVILYILISDFLLISTELPFTLLYLSLGYVKTTKLCLFWIFWDYTLQEISLVLTMYASIERYVLVFHSRFILRHKMLFHHVSLSLTTLYSFGIYMYLVLLYRCNLGYSYNPKGFLCGGACYFSGITENLYDTIVNVMLPTIALLIFNLVLIGRVVLQKRRVSQLASIPSTLKKNRRMILQLLAISSMALTTWFPWVIIILGQALYDANFGAAFIDVVVHYLPYFTSFASPFLALIGLPEIYARIRGQRIGPTTGMN